MNWQDHLQRWIVAGLIDTDTAAKIRNFETSRPVEGRLRWPAILAVVFGGILLAAGLFLFVSSRWDTLSPFARIATVVLIVVAFHVGGAFLGRFSALSTTLHALGTASLGGTIAIAQVFTGSKEISSTALLVWTVGAWIGLWLLGDIPQLVIAAILTPAWIVLETYDSPLSEPSRWAIAFLALTCIVYLSAARMNEKAMWRNALSMVGAVFLLPVTLVLSTSSASAPWNDVWLLLLPLVPAYALRRRKSLPMIGWAVWAYLQAIVAKNDMIISGYLLAGAASVVMTWWGSIEFRKDRCNLGIIGFIITVLSFYSVYFIDSLNRALGLVGLGILFLLGGWQLERFRRKLMRGIDEGSRTA